MQRLSRSRLMPIGLSLSVALAICATIDSASAQPRSRAETDAPETQETPEPETEPESLAPQGNESAESADEPSRTPPPRPSRARSRNPGRTNSVPRAPAMMGDFLGGGIPFRNGDGTFVGFLPVGSRRTKIAENGKALPMDRLFFNYNHYFNALTHEDDGRVDAIDVHQYTFGAEIAFCKHLWSAEVRMPFTSEISFGSTDIVAGGKVGNLVLNLKRSIYRSPTDSIVVGLGSSFPTGSDAHYISGAAFDTVRNEAVHIMPFIGFLRTPSDNWFYQMFLQADIAANGNTLIRTDGTFATKLNEADFLYFDLEVGHWLYQCPCRRYLPRAAALVELHGSVILRESDGVNFDEHISIPSPFDSLWTCTAALHFDVCEKIEKTALRIGFAFPLQRDHDAYFDGEFVVQLTRHF